MTSVKISTTEELLAVLPHQLGHRPEQCVAIVMLTDRIVGPVARVDIPPETHVRATAEHLLASLIRVGPTAALLVGYDSVPGESRSLLRALHAGLLGEGIGIIDHVVVRGGRWWGWCCRPADELDGLLPEHVEGHPLPDEATVPAVAELIARGSAPLASRDELGALVGEDLALSEGVGDALADLWEAFCGEVDAEHEEETEAVRARAARQLASVDRAPALWGQVLAPVGERGDTFVASDDDVARLGHSLVDKQWRDSLVAWMSPVMFPLDLVDDASRALLVEHAPAGPATTSEQSAVVLRRLLHLARRTPDEFSLETAAVCTVAACVAWGVGNGSTAGDALARALAVEPDYRLAVYLAQMVEHQLRPRQGWTEVAA